MKGNPVYREVEAHIQSEDFVAVPVGLKANKADYGTKIMAPAKTLKAFIDPRGIVEIPQSNIQATQLQGTGIFYFVIPRASLNVIRDPVCFRFNITSTTAYDLAPPAYWFSRYEILSNAGSGQILATNYSDTAYVLPTLFETNEDNLGFAQVGMHAFPSYRRDAQSNKINANTAKDFYLFLKAGFFSDIRLMLANINQDIWIRFYPTGSLTATPGGTSNITCNSLSLVCPQELMDEKDRALHVNYINSGVFMHNYLDRAYQLISNVTLNASTSTNIKLDALQGKSAFLLLFFRLASSAMSADNDGYVSSIVDVGGTTTFDIVNGTGQSLWSQGTPQRYDHMRFVVGNKMFPGQGLCKLPIVPIIFSQNVQDSMDGKINGYFQFNGSTDRQLQINTPALGNGEIQTITYSGGAPGAGFIQLFFRGVITAPLAFNTSAANAKIALDGLSSMKEAGLTSTFSSALNAGASFTITFSGTRAVKDLVTAILSPGVTTATCATTTITTEALPGWPGNAAYNISIYNLYHRDCFEKQGDFTVCYS